MSLVVVEAAAAAAADGLLVAVAVVVSSSSGFGVVAVEGFPRILPYTSLSMASRSSTVNSCHSRRSWSNVTIGAVKLNDGMVSYDCTVFVTKVVLVLWNE